MDKVIKIGNTDVTLRATASTVRRYRAKFGRDLLLDMQKFTNGEQNGEALESILNLTYIMAKQANDKIPDDIDEWLDSFDVFPIADISQEVVTLWMNSTITTVKPKN